MGSDREENDLYGRLIIYSRGDFIMCFVGNTYSIRLEKVQCTVGWLLEFYILVTAKVISGRVPSLWWCRVMVTLQCSSTWNSGCHHSEPISLSVTIFWHWANQSLVYPTNDKRQARKWQLSIFISEWFDSTRNQTHDFPHAKPTLYQFEHRVWVLWVRSGMLGFMSSQHLRAVMCGVVALLHARHYCWAIRLK